MAVPAVAVQLILATLTSGSMAGTRFAATVTFDPAQVSPSGQSYVRLGSFDFSLDGVAFTRGNLQQGGQAIFTNGILTNVTGSFQGGAIPRDSPVHNITFGFGGNRIIGYEDLSGHYGSGTFLFRPHRVPRGAGGLAHGDDRLAQYIPARRDAEPWPGGRGHAPVDSRRSALGDADGHVAVEVGRGEEHRRRRAVRQMRDRGGDDIAAPRVLYGQSDSQRQA